MKCYFRETVECPVPEEELTGNYCCACATWSMLKYQKDIAESTKKMVDAQTPPIAAEETKEADEKRDVV